MIDRSPELFCRNVQRLRLHHCLTISQMARILELSDELLILLESGVLTDEMTVRILYNIFHHFGILPSQMMEEALPL